MIVYDLINILKELDGNKKIKVIAIVPEGNSESDIKNSDVVERDGEYAILGGME